MPLADQLKVWEELKMVQEAFPFTDEGCVNFANYCINNLIKGNPTINRVQVDIMLWLFHGSRYRMIMANRGIAKTTLTAIYAVFRLIHDPKLRILIFSAGGKMAKEISSWVIQIIQGLEILKCMQADRNEGDRASVEGYDVNWVLKGAEKSPSVKCLGVDSNAQGSRADVLIGDDVESLLNARTVGGRELLEDLTKEFESICADGDIIYLGTPQTAESIYNNLPARGYSLRIWTARYPTEKELENYGDHLAPMLLSDIKKDPSIQTGYGLAGNQGKPTAPTMFSDENLTSKQISMGNAKFQLQYMLNTALSDNDRYPLKLNNLIVADFDTNQAPCLPVWSQDTANIYKESVSISNKREHQMFWAVKKKYEYTDYHRCVMHIDPAGLGKNGDETGYAVVKLIGSTIYIVEASGIEGGYAEESLMKLVEIAKRNKVGHVLIEKNFGNGAHSAMLKPLFTKYHPVTIEEVWESGQKELRIIDVIEPVLSRHQLVINPQVIKHDLQHIQKYPVATQMTYSLLYQMAFITRDKGCLRHDDILDSLASAIRYFTESIDFDTASVIAREQAHKQEQFFDEWRNRSRNNKLAYSPSARRGCNRFN